MVAGATNAALNGAGWQGILIGAAIGGVLGGGLGGLASAGHGFAAGIIGGAIAVGGAVNSYQHGGWESVGDYAGGVIGSIGGSVIGYGIGTGLGNALKSPSPQQQQAKAQTALKTDQKPTPKARLETNYDVEGKPKSFNLVYEREPEVGAKVYRVFDNKLHGFSWTPIDPRTVPNYAEAAGLYNKGGFLVEGTLLDTSGVMVRPALPGPDGTGGGLAEWVIPNSKAQVKIDKIQIYGLEGQ